MPTGYLGRFTCAPMRVPPLIALCPDLSQARPQVCSSQCTPHCGSPSKMLYVQPFHRYAFAPMLSENGFVQSTGQGWASDRACRFCQTLCPSVDKRGTASVPDYLVMLHCCFCCIVSPFVCFSVPAPHPQGTRYTRPKPIFLMFSRANAPEPSRGHANALQSHVNDKATGHLFSVDRVSCV